MRCRRFAVLTTAMAVCIFCSPRALLAEELWSVREGKTAFSFDVDRLAALGIEVVVSGEPISLDGEARAIFAINSDSTLTFSAEGGTLMEFLGGRILHVGDLSIQASTGAILLDAISISQFPGEPGVDQWTLEGITSHAAGFSLGRVKAGFDPSQRRLTIHSPELRLSPAQARVLGDPTLSGALLGTLTVHAVGEWVGGDSPSPTPNRPAVRSSHMRMDGCDVSFCELHSLSQYGRTADVVGLGVATTSWNLGNADCLWFPIPNTDHPFIVMNMYRLKADRFEQIGQSWVKHGFYALAYTQCGGQCIHEPGHGQGNWLGQGCTDTYSAPLNAIQNGMGPRYEVNPWTGGWVFAGSHNSVTHGHNSTEAEHRLQVHDADLDPALNVGATYYIEGYYCMLDDVNVMDSASWKPVTISGAPGGTWLFGMSAPSEMPVRGFAVDAWLGATQTVIAQQIPVVEFASPDGRCVLSAKATDLGGGTWHYEYALFNIDMDRKVDSFTMPLFQQTVVSNIGFSAAEHHEEGAAGYSNDPWTATVIGETITWSTIDNPIKWGTLYNFWFDADQEPHVYPVTVTLGLFEPGTPLVVTGDILGPFQGPPDCNGNGIPDGCDLDCEWGGCGPPCGGSSDCNGNGIPDECEDDCNSNGVPDDCDIDPTDPDGNGQVSPDCQPNGIPDECEVPPIGPAANDCNNNGIPDVCDISSGGSDDCDGNGVPDECELAANDCNLNGMLDACDISAGSSSDCQFNGTPDECEIDINSTAPGGPFFCLENCDPDCNNNGTPDECDISSGSSNDCDDSGVPDECEGFPACNNDRCENATALCPGAYYGGTNPNMDSDGAAGCGSSMTSPDIWYKFTSQTNGTVIIDTCGVGNFDTVLSVHTGCPGVPGNQLGGVNGCDDNSCPDSNRSRLSFWAIARTPYLVRVSGFEGATGDFLLTISGPECETPGDDIRGGLLWDSWWVAANAQAPTGDHPLYPAPGPQSGSITYRCKECHGWDYKGVDGAYGSGEHYTGIPGVFNSTMSRSSMFNLVRSESVANGHGFTNYGLWDQDVWDLVEFLQNLVIDTDAYIDSGGQFIGDEARGAANYNNGGSIPCASCHGPAGKAINFGTPEDPFWMGHIAWFDPWKFLHKARMGHPGSSMPSWLKDVGTDQGAADIGLYSQLNFCHISPDGDMNLDGSTDGADVQAFVDAVISSSTDNADVCPGDFNNNGTVEMSDLPSMVSALLGM